MSKATVLLPLPLTPVMTVKQSRGICISMFFRLCSRARWMRIAWLVIGADRRCSWARVGPACAFVRSADNAVNLVAASYSRSAVPVWLCLHRATSPGVPTQRTSPPASPPSGPRSMIQSAARMTSRLCSMTTSECPLANSSRKALSNLAISSKCNPVVGSSKRNKVPLVVSALRPALAR